MKNFSWIFLALLLAALVGLSGVASGDYWEQTSSLLPGTYLVTWIDLEETAEWDYFHAYAAQQGMPNPDIKGTAIFMTTRIRLDREYTTAGLCKYLNNDPRTVPEQSPIIFAQDEETGRWTQVNLPCRWMDGEYAI